MKTSKMILVNACLAFVLLANFSCSNEDDDSNAEEAITQEEAAQLVASSLEEDSGGSIETMVKLTIEVQVTIEAEYTCGFTYEDGISYQYDQNGIDASYTGDWAYQIHCNDQNLPDSATYSYEKTATASTPRISATGSSSMSGSLDGLEADGSTYTLTGTYQGDYSQQLIVSKKNVESELNMQLNSLVIDKETDSITSGSGSFTLTGTSNNASFSYSGTIEFMGNGSATVTIEGQTYIVLSN
ncbi:hypothetical protein [Flagellimonas crocea]|uniref:hypothetical protein n=1 Tax=Flagellimonas crocea TaxID=3067311 RepID=UPI00296EE2C2|nr:hypothetical protein [Muricauda sp. DH64]